MRADETDKKREICDKAREIFLRFGYRKTTVEDIGKACGMSKTALYHYFSGKEDVFTAVVHSESDRLLTKMRKGVDAVEDPKQKLAAMLRIRMRHLSDILSNLPLDQEQMDEMFPMAAKAQRKFHREEVELIRQILAEGEQQKVFHELRSPLVPALIISGFRGLEMNFPELSRSSASLKEGFETMLEMLFHGLCR